MPCPYAAQSQLSIPVFSGLVFPMNNFVEQRINRRTPRQSLSPKAPTVSTTSYPSDPNAKASPRPPHQKSPHNPYPARCPCPVSVRTTKNKFGPADLCPPTTDSA